MANFYPVNTPLINYYFYKAPFISNGFSLTNYSILSGGTGYNVGDIIITSGGVFTTPVIFLVATVNSGAVTSVTINNNGNYTTVPTTLSQAYTSGTGTGATFNSLVFDSNYLQPSGPNIPLAGGYIFFYEDENRNVQANTYSNVSDPNNPVVNPNPIQLGSSGDYTLFYLDDRFYYIVITDYTGDQSNPVQVIEHYNPSDVLSNISAFNDNFIVNPQFNYPIEFYHLTDDTGYVFESTTTVAWSWEFLQDQDTETENYVTFNNVSGQQIEGSPVFECVLNSSPVSSAETLKDFRAFLGTVDFNQGNPLTFCAQMESKTGRSLTVNLYLELYYGMGGSDSQLILLNTFTVGTTLSKYSFSFTVPSISGFSVGEDSYLAIRIQPGIQQVCIFGMTNVMVVPGNVSLPVFVDESEGFSKALILGDSTNISGAGLYQNYSSYYYSNGMIFPYADTGTIVLCPTNLIQNFRAVCDGSSRLISGYTVNNIPNQRLYNAIGTTFGSAGDLIVTSAGNVVTFKSPVGARAHSPYTGGNTTFTVNNVALGLLFGFNLVNNYNGTVTGTYADMFAPSITAPSFGTNITPPMSNSGNGLQTYWGTAGNVISGTNITFTTINPGSGSSFASFLMTFNNNIPANYQTRVVATPNGAPPYLNHQCSSFIEFSTFTNNVRQFSAYQANAIILFSLDGVVNPVIGQYNGNQNPPILFQQITFAGVPPYGAIVNFYSSASMSQNINTFVNTISNPFIWTVTVVSAPSAGQYFLYSSATVDYYGWFTVNGVGTDPAIGGRTGIEIPIATGQTTAQISEIIASTIDSAEFNVPSPAVLPIIPTSSPVSWFINI